MAHNHLDPATPSFILPDKQDTPDARNLQALSEAGRQLRDKVIDAINAGFEENTVDDAAAWFTGREWHDGSEVWAKYIDIGNLPNTTSANTAHGLTTPTFIRAYGMADNGTNQLPLPLGHPTDTANIALTLTDTNVVVQTGSDRSAYTGWVIVEYLVTP